MKYEVNIEDENCYNNIRIVRKKFNDSFNTLADAKKYVTSIKNELKDYFKNKKVNTITVDIYKYSKDESECEMVHSVNVI